MTKYDRIIHFTRNRSGVYGTTNLTIGFVRDSNVTVLSITGHNKETTARKKEKIVSLI